MSLGNLYKLLFEVPQRCKGERDEGVLTIESIPANEGSILLNVEVRLRISVWVSAEEKERFLQASPQLPFGLHGPLPKDLHEPMSHFVENLKRPWRQGRHGSIVIKVKPSRDGRRKMIFRESLDRSFVLSPRSIESLSE